MGWNIGARTLCDRCLLTLSRARRSWMKREGLLRHLRRHGCILRREGKEHSLWENPQTGTRKPCRGTPKSQHAG